MRLRPTNNTVVMEYDLFVETGLSDAQLDDVLRFVFEVFPDAGQYLDKKVPGVFSGPQATSAPATSTMNKES